MRQILNCEFTVKTILRLVKMNGFFLFLDINPLSIHKITGSGFSRTEEVLETFALKCTVSVNYNTWLIPSKLQVLIS